MTPKVVGLSMFSSGSQSLSRKTFSSSLGNELGVAEDEDMKSSKNITHMCSSPLAGFMIKKTGKVESKLCFMGSIIETANKSSINNEVLQIAISRPLDSSLRPTLTSFPFHFMASRSYALVADMSCASSTPPFFPSFLYSIRCDNVALAIRER